MRKTYIVQFAPDGTRGREAENELLKSVLCDDPERQYPTLIAEKALEKQPQ